MNPNILIADDRLENLVALEALLEECIAVVYKANSGNEALSLMLEKEFALVLLDVQMPEMDGFEVAELMRSNPNTRHTPIIFVTAISNEKEYVFKGYDSGAVDYLTKPIEPSILRSKVDIFLGLWRQRNELARTVAELEKASRLIESQQKELRDLAILDHLTGLYQRRWFDEIAIKEVSQSRRHKTPLALAMLDIDHFKQVNDNHGHKAGDAILVQLAQILRSTVRKEDTVFRYGGEEFIVLMPNTDNVSASRTCERIQHSIANVVFRHADGELVITVSIGVAELGEQYEPDINVLLETADKLLYQAKAQGRNQVCCAP